MIITRGQLRRIIREEAGRFGARGVDSRSMEAREGGSAVASDEFDAALRAVMDAARAHGVSPEQVLDALRDAIS